MLKLPYQETAGASIWMATMTRTDSASAVRAVARFCENAGLAHNKAVLKVMQYLRNTKEWGIAYGGQGCRYADSDFGACLDTRRSVSGAVVMLAKEVVIWHSRRQAVTASGTSEAEYVALSKAV